MYMAASTERWNFETTIQPRDCVADEELSDDEDYFCYSVRKMLCSYQNNQTTTTEVVFRFDIFENDGIIDLSEIKFITTVFSLNNITLERTALLETTNKKQLKSFLLEHNIPPIIRTTSSLAIHGESYGNDDNINYDVTRNPVLTIFPRQHDFDPDFVIDEKLDSFIDKVLVIINKDEKKRKMDLIGAAAARAPTRRRRRHRTRRNSTRRRNKRSK